MYRVFFVLQLSLSLFLFMDHGHAAETARYDGTVYVSKDKWVRLSFPHAAFIGKVGVIAGQSIKQNDPLLELCDPVAWEGYHRALSEYRFALSESERIKVLLPVKLATQSQLETAEKALLDAKRKWETQNSLISNVPSQWLIAPFDGIVMQVFAIPGENVLPGIAMLELACKKDLQVNLEVDPFFTSKVAKGMPVQITSTCNENQSAKGVISDVKGLADPLTFLIHVVVDFCEEIGDAWLPGMKVQGDISQ
jgi:membrane fusion protein, multidrug efflux system